MIQLGAEADAVLDAYRDELLAAGSGVGALLFVWAAGWLLVVPAVTRVIAAKNPNNATLARAVQRYLRAVFVVLAAAAAVVAAGFGHLLTGSALVVAALTLALGVAGREAIGNLVSGVFLVADPDFNVEDWIAWEGGAGVVESISFRVTRVRTQNNEIVVVPNTLLTTGEVTRPYGRENFRVTVEFGVGYDEDLSVVREALREEALAVDGVRPNPEPLVRLLDLGDDAVELRVELWVHHPDRSDVVHVRSTYLQRVVDRLGDQGVDINPASQHELSGELSLDDSSRDSAS